MNIVSYFTNKGAPETGLSPTIRIRDLSDNSLIVADEAMTEVGDGEYKYEFANDVTKEYSVRTHSGSQYKYAVIPVEIWGRDDTQKLLNENLHKAVISSNDQHIT